MKNRVARTRLRPGSDDTARRFENLRVHEESPTRPHPAIATRHARRRTPLDGPSDPSSPLKPGGRRVEHTCGTNVVRPETNRTVKRMRWMLASLAVSTALASLAVSAMFASPAFAGAHAVSPDATRSARPTSEPAVASDKHHGRGNGATRRKHRAHRSHRSTRPAVGVIRALRGPGDPDQAPWLPRAPRSTPQPAGNRVPIADHHRHETRVSRSGGGGGKARLQHSALAPSSAGELDARDHSEAAPRIRACLTRRGGMIRGRAPPRCEDNDDPVLARVRSRAAASPFAAMGFVEPRASKPTHPVSTRRRPSTTAQRHVRAPRDCHAARPVRLRPDPRAARSPMFTTHAAFAASTGSGVRALRDSMAPHRRACVFRGDPGHPYAARPEGTAAYAPSPSFGGITCPASV